MRLGGHRPGSLTAFLDGASGETLLQVAADSSGEPRIAYRLYDADGNLVCDSEGFRTFPDGLCLEDSRGEVLLLLPDSPLGNIHYRLYSPDGRLLGCSDGCRTQILNGLRIEGAKAPSRTKQASKA